MKKIFFSIIIPTLNEENYLPSILTDLSQQIDKDFEVTVVDCSINDKTQQACMNFSRRLPIKFYRTKKKSVSFQRNYGASHSVGNYLVFIDADSRIGSAFTKNLKKFIFKEKGLVIIPYIIADESTPQSTFAFRFVNFLIELSHTIGKPFSAGGNMIWEKNFFHMIGGFEENLYIAEDHNIIQKAYRWGVRVKFVPQLKIRFNLRRWRREGQLVVLYKEIISTGYLLVKGDIKTKIFEYEMGGRVHNVNKSFLPFEENFKKSFNQLKYFFKQYLS